MKPDTYQYLFLVPLRTVLIKGLDKNRTPINNSTASGFILKENNELFLYTCWHVVTGYDLNNLEIGHQLPKKRYLTIFFQKNCAAESGHSYITGKDSIKLDLYDDSKPHGIPTWLQDEEDQPNFFLNKINIKVPKHHDIVKIKLPSTVNISELQIIDSNDLFTEFSWIGEKLFLSGYPYGFSTLGDEQPSSIVLTRFIAANQLADRDHDIVIDGPGAPGMSGGPVFIERNRTLKLFGVYTGSIYPDYHLNRNEKQTSLGIVCTLKNFR